MRSKAAWRLRDCDRDSDAAARTVGPYRLSRRARCRGPKVEEFATSNWTSTRLNVRLACWPPGPPDVVARQVNSLMGIASALCTRSVDPGLGRRVGVTGRTGGLEIGFVERHRQRA